MSKYYSVCQNASICVSQDLNNRSPLEDISGSAGNCLKPTTWYLA